MQKVIYVNYGSEKASERLESLNSHLSEGWKVVSTQPVNQFVSCDNGRWAAGGYGVTFIIEKD